MARTPACWRDERCENQSGELVSSNDRYDVFTAEGGEDFAEGAEEECSLRISATTSAASAVHSCLVFKGVAK